MKRREFLTLTMGALQAQVPLRFFTAAEAAIVVAATERIFPADASSPGATQAAVAVYIDRQLAGPYGRDKYRYTKGPWVASVPEHGNQNKATPRDIYREGLAKFDPAFATESPAVQDRFLQSIETSPFFQMLRTHTIEGMFCDPLHGGNAGMVGWKMIGFPGPLMSYRENEHPSGPPRSLEQISGRKVKGWEEEPA